MKFLSDWNDRRHGPRNTENYREIEISGSRNGYRANKHSNRVSTTKYKWYSFIPKGLYEQFRRVANLYFAFHAAITLTPVTPVNPISTILPLTFIIGVSLVKEGIEDLRRARADRDVNNRLVRVLDTDGVFRKRRWKELSVGNIVKIDCDEFFPADLLFLFSSNLGGSCYVETANLDGETNLKVKKCLDDTAQLSEDELKTFFASVQCEQPNPSIYKFIGNLSWKSRTLPLGPGQILLRGSKLRNTEFVYGAVLFTGYETKMMMNSIDPPSKRSSVEHQLDYIIIFQLLLLVCMSATSGMVFASWLSLDKTNHWYLQLNSGNGISSVTRAAFNYQNPYVAGVLQFFTCLVLYGYFVPISLYVSLEIVKVIQAIFINSDIEMYHSEMDKPAAARTSNLNEELGQVNTILSDKTGTLTRNQMEFLKCSISGVNYGTGTTEVEESIPVNSGKATPSNPIEQTCISETVLEKGFALRDSRLDGLNWQDQPNREAIFRFLEILSVCNTIVIEGPADPDAIKYIAESPDEASFVVAAKRLGVFLFDRSDSKVQLKIFNKDGSASVRVYSLLNILEFTSSRKRMSVIVRDPEGRLLLFCKGADDVIFERLADDKSELARITKQHMCEYGEAGLRTLAIAYRALDEEMYTQWQDRWIDAKKEMDQDTLNQKLSKLADDVECNLTLVGASGIEDKLQVGVPETISRLAEAGVKIWVLTGDKMETAINIGYACKLLNPDMVKHIVRLEDNLSLAYQNANSESHAGFIKQQIDEGHNSLNNNRSKSVSHAVIIDGRSLEIVLETESLKNEFLGLALRCESVICCRTSPIQKALITELVRNDGKQICLAIGDGANDVGMIQKANIGVGISGMEGQQAAMCADFSIAQFRFLERLLLIHGAWCYRRTTFMIKYFFYKNFVFGFSIFLFNAYTRFSGQSIYADWFLSLYNVVFTSAPVIVIAVLDQDVGAKSRLRFPKLYTKGQLNGNLLPRRIISWMLNGTLQAVICFFLVIHAYNLGKVPDRIEGKIVGLFTIGTTMYTCVLFIVNIQVAIVIQYWSWLHHFVVWGELVLWFLFLIVFGALPVKLSGEIHNLFIRIVSTSSRFYMVTLLTTVSALLPSFTIHCFSRNFNPSDNQVVQEIEKMDVSSGHVPQTAVGDSKDKAVELTSGAEGLENKNSRSSKYPLLQGSNSFEVQEEPHPSFQKQSLVWNNSQDTNAFSSTYNRSTELVTRTNSSSQN